MSLWKESVIVVHSLIENHLIKGVENYIYDQYLDSKKSDFANYSTLFLSFKAVDVKQKL